MEMVKQNDDQDLVIAQQLWHPPRDQFLVMLWIPISQHQVTSASASLTLPALVLVTLPLRRIWKPFVAGRGARAADHPGFRARAYSLATMPARARIRWNVTPILNDPARFVTAFRDLRFVLPGCVMQIARARVLWAAATAALMAFALRVWAN
ncbi:MAG: hypothetical protein U0Y68_08430 [Blastocatellia bacterium]